MNHTVKDIDLVQQTDYSKLCKDCKFYKSLGKHGSYCESPRRTGISVVRGEYRLQKDPLLARKDQYDCGPSGGWFEPKPWWRKLL